MLNKFYSYDILIDSNRGGYMYLDAVIVIALVIFAVCWFRSFSKSVYAFAIIDLFLRILNYIANHIGIKGFASWVNKVFPNSIPAIIGRYTNGILCDILVWIYVAFMACFLFYTVRVFIHKK